MAFEPPPLPSPPAATGFVPPPLPEAPIDHNSFLQSVGQEFKEEDFGSLSSAQHPSADVWRMKRKVAFDKGKEFWNWATTSPLERLTPEAPEMPNMPALGVYNPALMAVTYRQFRNLAIGMENPLSIGLMGVGGGLAVFAKESPAAMKALQGMSVTFAGWFGLSTAESVGKLWNTMHDPKATFQDQADAHLDVFTNALLTVGAGLGIAETAKSPVLGELKDQTPHQAVETIKVASLTEKDPVKAAVLDNAAEHLKASLPVAPTDPLKETALKNAVAEMERDGYGLPEADETEHRAMSEGWIRAGTALAKDPESGARLAKALQADPNMGLSDDQSALLLRHKVGLEKALNEAVDITNDPEASPESKSAAGKQSEALSQELQDFMDAVHARGSEWGREGRWRQAMAKEDYSFAAQERLLRAAKGGAPLTEDERTGLLNTIEQLKRKQTQLDAHQEAQGAKQPGETRDQLAGKKSDLEERLNKVRQAEEAGHSTTVEKGARQPVNRVTDFLGKQAEAARGRIKARMAEGRVQSGLDPADIADHAIVGADFIARGVADFGQWSSVMLKEFGERIRPYLKAIFDQATQEHSKAKAKFKHSPTDEQRLNQWKARTSKRIAELKDRLERNDFTPTARRAVALDDKGLQLKGELEAIKQKFGEAREAAKEAAKPKWQKGMTQTAGIARASALSGYHTLAKLFTYSLAKFAETPLNEAVGALIRKAPGMENISAKANLEAGVEAKAIAKFYTKAAMDGMADAWQTLKSGKSNLKAELGDAKTNAKPVHWYDYFGISHMAEKSPLLRGAFELALEKNYAHAYTNGLDVTSPEVQAALRKEAYDYAQRAILQENNMFADWINSATNRLEAVDPKTKKPDAYRVALSTMIKTFVTKGIVRTPANYVMQVLERGPMGWARAGAGFARAQTKAGALALTDREANTITRLIKVGAPGAAMWLWGCLDALKPPEQRTFGGYYQPGDKRDKKDVSFGRIRVDGVEFPHFVTHNPLTENAQMASTLMRVAMSKLGKKDQENKGILAGTMAAVMGVASQAPIASPITRSAESVERGNSERILWDEITGLIPQLIQNIAVDTDKEKRTQPKSLKEAVELTIPGLRENVPVKQDKDAPKLEYQSNRPVSFNARGPSGRPLKVTLPSDQAQKMLSSRLDSLKKLRDALPE